MIRGRVLSATVVLCTVGTIATAQAPLAFGGNERSTLVKERGLDRDGQNRRYDDERDRRSDRPNMEPVRMDTQWRYEPVSRPIHRATHKEYTLPRGECITSIVITAVGGGSSHSSQKLTLSEDRRTFPITLSGDQSFTMSFGKGWHIDCTTTICGELCNGDFEVWATTDRGPIALTACYK